VAEELDLDPDPLRQFGAWYDEALAAGLPLPEAMTLATATKDGRPSARTVLLKGVDRRGFLFYTNYESRKARELDENPRAALVFHWPLEPRRQVCVTGEVRKLPPGESEAYFRTRPLGSRFAAWSSRQSEPVESRQVLDQAFAEAERQFADDEVPLPPWWGGYVLEPDTIEFWRNRPNRMHDRIRYRRDDRGGWVLERLSP
jgi:pyridoxamine 5'-phosphate oxidase